MYPLRHSRTSEQTIPVNLERDTTLGQAAHPPCGGDASPLAWRQLRFLNYCRLLLAGLFFFLAADGTPPPPLGSHHPDLFRDTLVVYLVLGLLSAATIHWRLLPFNAQVYLQVMLDIAVMTLLMSASGGVKSGLGMLLVLAIAGGSLLMEGRTARLFAAIATLAVLAEQIHNRLAGDLEPGYTQAGLLGAAFFATAILAHGLARRLRASEALAARRGVDLANMAQLTEYVIQRMQTGIVVVDSQGRIRLANQSACRLLDCPELKRGQSLATAVPDLGRELHRWLEESAGDGPETERGGPRTIGADTAVQPRFARLGAGPGSGVLIFLEDTAATVQQAQQMKLASLGRLTASIAHEVRNPLGAISHAGQLLAESPHLDPSDRRLTEIIQDHSRRVNTIIENIMQLSRQGRSHPEDLYLLPWLEQFRGEFCLGERLAPHCMRLDIHPPHTRVRADASQLHQVLWNLCHNAIQHGGRDAPPSLEIRGGLDKDFGTPYLDIIDDGPGIAPEVAEHIFEPFFTTTEQGTGLGLYIARELCESNQARLHYLKQDGRSRFRITFADPRRRQVA